MHKILYFGGIFTGGGMLIISVVIWFSFGIKKAFRDILSYGSKKKWSVDQRMQNKTMPLRKTNSGKLMSSRLIKRTAHTDSNIENTEETIFLENYHGQTLENYKKSVDFEIIEEINLIAGGR